MMMMLMMMKMNSIIDHMDLDEQTVASDLMFLCKP